MAHRAVDFRPAAAIRGDAGRVASRLVRWRSSSTGEGFVGLTHAMSTLFAGDRRM